MHSWVLTTEQAHCHSSKLKVQEWGFENFSHFLSLQYFPWRKINNLSLHLQVLSLLKLKYWKMQMAGSISNIAKLWNPDFPGPSHSRIVFLDVYYLDSSGLCRAYKGTKTVFKWFWSAREAGHIPYTQSGALRDAAGAGGDTYLK